MPPSSGLLAWLLASCLVWLTCLSPQASAARVPGIAGDVGPGVLASASNRGTSKTLRQTDVINDRWGSKPRCLAVYLDAPAWMTYRIELKVTPRDGQVSQECLNNRVRWRSMVVGTGEYMPRSLAVAVGYRDLTFNSTYITDAQYKEDPIGIEIPDDYEDDPPPPNPDSEVTNIITEQAAACFAAYSAQTLAGVDKPTAQNNLMQCLSRVSVPGAPSPPPPSPPPPPLGRGKARRVATKLRKATGLAPFLRPPDHISNTFPYTYATLGVSAAKINYQTFLMPKDACPEAFNDPEWPSQPLTQPVQQFSSCYYTQTIVYINYDGGCFDQDLLNPFASFPVEISVDAQYTNYKKCAEMPLLRMSIGLQVIFWVTSVPIALFMFIVIAPTLWRMATRAVLLLGLIVFKRDSDTKQRLKFLMLADLPLARWKWWVSLGDYALIREFVKKRKHLVYACVTTARPNGRNRVLMVLIVASCTVCVSIMVWRPTTQIVLNSNPTKITMSLDSTGGDYDQLYRYMQIVGASMFLGCIAYFALLTNTNEPSMDDAERLLRRRHGGIIPGLDNPAEAAGGPPMIRLPGTERKGIKGWFSNVKDSIAMNHTWTIQRIITALATIYMTVLLSLQIINIGVVLRIMSPLDRPAYFLIIGIQTFNVLGVIILQFRDFKISQERAITRFKEVEIPARLAKLKNHRTKQSRDPRRHHRVDVDPRRPKPNEGQGLAGGPNSSMPRRKNNLELKKPQAKNRLWNWWKPDRFGRPTNRAEYVVWQERMDDEEKMSIWKQIKLVYLDALHEDAIVVEWKGKSVKAKTFKYPPWFLAAMVVAFYMLWFHYLKSRAVAYRLGRCVVSWSECEIDFIRNLANTYSFEQLAAVRSTNYKVMDTLEKLAPLHVVIDRLLVSLGVSTSTARIMRVMDAIDDFTTPGNSRRARWVEDFGERLVRYADAGFAVGLVLGMITLMMAMISFKRIFKLHRAEAIKRRIAKACGPNRIVLSGTGATDNLTVLTTVVGAPATDVTSTSYVAGMTTFMPLPAGGRHSIQHLNPVWGGYSSTSAVGGPAGSSPFMGGTAEDDTVYEPVDDTGRMLDEEEVFTPEPEVTSSAKAAALRAFSKPIAQVVFFLGVLLSSSVVQLYAVGVVLTVIMALAFSDWFWVDFMSNNWQFVAITILVLLINKWVLTGLVGNQYITNGHRIHRPAGWYAFVIIASITNLVLGLFLAVIRIVWLVLSTIFTVGLLDRTIMAIGSRLDQSYNSFLAGIHLQNGVSVLADKRSFQPGPKWRATKRWMAAAHYVRQLGPTGFEELARERGMVAPMPLMSTTTEVFAPPPTPPQPDPRYQ